MSQEYIEFGSKHFYIIVYFATLIIALLNYRKFFDTELKYFPALIAYTFFNELLGYFIRYSEQFAFFEDITFANDLIYNIYDVIYYMFFLWVFWNLEILNEQKKKIRLSAVLIILFYLINALVHNPLIMGLYYANSFSSIILVFIVLTYLKIQAKDLDWKIKKYNLMFWVSIGLLVFHTILPIIYLLLIYDSDLWLEFNFQLILRISIAVMYLLFNIGFLIGRRRAFG